MPPCPLCAPHLSSCADGVRPSSPRAVAALGHHTQDKHQKWGTGFSPAPRAPPGLSAGGGRASLGQVPTVLPGPDRSVQTEQASSLVPE